MRKILLGIAAAAALAVTGAASAQGVSVGVGPGGIGVGVHEHRGWHEGWHRRHWGPGGCRVVVRRFWRNGHPVVVRRRECF